MSKQTSLPQSLQDAFSRLLNQMSPENLSNDGELNRSQMATVLTRIHREWAELERVAGRRVTQEEVEKNQRRLA